MKNSKKIKKLSDKLLDNKKYIQYFHHLFLSLKSFCKYLLKLVVTYCNTFCVTNWGSFLAPLGDMYFVTLTVKKRALCSY